jgi:hypothetical protein
VVTDREEFARLVGLAHDATSHLASRTSALQLYRDARDVAEERLPGPLGVAVACVLAGAAYHRQQARVGGCLGADKSMMALAIAVLEVVPNNLP